MNITFITHLWEDFGPRTLAGILSQQGHKIRRVVIEASYDKPLSDTSLDSIAELCRESDLIGYGLFTMHFPKARQITEHLKTKYSTPVIWGGVHPTALPEQCIKYADVVFMGESESCLPEFVRRLEEDGEVPVGIKGTWVKNDEGIHKTEFPDLIEELDSIPYPHYNFNEEFLLRDEEVIPITAELYSSTVKRYMTFPTRGCPYKCTFCINNLLEDHYSAGARFRRKSIDGIIDELKWAKENLPFFNEVCFGDDAFLASKEYMIKDFSARYKNEIGLELVVTGATPATVKEGKLVPLMDAGMSTIRMGIQTGSERTRQEYKRTHAREKIMAATRLLNKYSGGMSAPPSYDIILDNPWENDEDIIETLMLMAEIPDPYTLTIYSLTFYPGTDLYDKALAEGLITEDAEYAESFFWCQDTYLNRLFLIIQERAPQGKNIPLWLMKVLTNKELRESRIAPLIYALIYKREDFREYLRQFSDHAANYHQSVASGENEPSLLLAIISLPARFLRFVSLATRTILSGDIARAQRFISRKFNGIFSR